MAENRFPSGMRDTVCLDTERVMDACRDRDCFENVRVYLSEYGNQILESTGNVRAKNAEILWASVGLDPIQFNRGFYSVTVRFYVRVDCEACGGPGRASDLTGLSVIEKRVILYGGESNVSVWRSNGVGDGFCTVPSPDTGEKMVPTAIVEAVDPVLLGSRIWERLCDSISGSFPGRELPEAVASALDAPIDFVNLPNRILTVSLGLFSLVRIVRPGQFLVSASEYSVPEKECRPIEEENPCRAFRNMPFPVAEFSITPPPEPRERPRCCGDRN